MSRHLKGCPATVLYDDLSFENGLPAARPTGQHKHRRTANVVEAQHDPCVHDGATDDVIPQHNPTMLCTNELCTNELCTNVRQAMAHRLW